jgi:hypothetical protein
MVVSGVWRLVFDLQLHMWLPPSSRAGKTPNSPTVTTRQHPHHPHLHTDGQAEMEPSRHDAPNKTARTSPAVPPGVVPWCGGVVGLGGQRLV